MARFKCRHAGDWGYENGAQFMDAEYDRACGMEMPQALWAQQYAPQPDQSGWLNPYQLPLPVVLLCSGHWMPMDQQRVDVQWEQDEHTPHLADVGRAIPIHTFSNFLPRANVRWCRDVDREQVERTLERAQKQIQKLEKELQWQANSCLMSQTAISVLEEQVQDLQSAIEIFLEDERNQCTERTVASEHVLRCEEEAGCDALASEAETLPTVECMGPMQSHDELEVRKLPLERSCEAEPSLAGLRDAEEPVATEGAPPTAAVLPQMLAQLLTCFLGSGSSPLAVSQTMEEPDEKRLSTASTCDSDGRPAPEDLLPDASDERAADEERMAAEGALPIAAVLPGLPIGPHLDVERLPCGPDAPEDMVGAAVSPGRRVNAQEPVATDGAPPTAAAPPQLSLCKDIACNDQDSCDDEQQCGDDRPASAQTEVADRHAVDERRSTADAACQTDGEDCTVGPQPRPKALEGIEVRIGECSPHDLHVPNLLPYLSVQELMSWRLVSRRTRSPEALLTHLEEMGSMDRSESVVAFAEKLDAFLVDAFTTNPKTSLAAAFGGDAEQQKLYECRLWCMALASENKTHFAQSVVDGIVRDNLESLLRHGQSTDTRVAWAASLVVSNYASDFLPCVQQRTAVATLALMEDLVESNMGDNLSPIGFCNQVLARVWRSLSRPQRQKWVSLLVKLLMGRCVPEEIKIQVIQRLDLVFSLDGPPTESYAEAEQQLQILAKSGAEDLWLQRMIRLYMQSCFS
ncbi:unnamed protein product [Symbiodinium sp. CCMP2592]|nr:unnamed protein product [Symbiodinium sp. CCMP2592]